MTDFTATKNIILKTLSCSQTEFFQEFTRKFDDYYDTLTSGTIKRIDRERQKGLAFEELCYRMIDQKAFLKLRCAQVWRYQDFPHKEEMGLPKRDEGIDLIIRHENGKYSPVQCKYRKKPTTSEITITSKAGKTYQKRLYWQLSWKRDLATFHALCERTGPWFKRVVITNAPSILWKGRKQTMDLTICRGTWALISKHTFSEAIGLVSHHLTEEPVEKLNVEDLRQKRLLAFQ